MASRVKSNPHYFMPDNPTWTTEDAVALRQFLQNNPRFLAELARRKPQRAEKGAGIEAAAVAYARRDGADQIIEAIQALAAQDSAQETSPYIGDAQ